MKLRAVKLFSQKGFTLLEVMAATLIVAVGLLGIVKLQAHFVGGTSVAKQRTEALALAQDKVEQLRTFEVLPTTNNKVAYSDIASSTDTISGLNATYTRTWTVTDGTSPDRKTINVAVTWTSQDNDSLTVNETSIIGKTDPVLQGHSLKSTQAPPYPTGYVHPNVPVGAIMSGDGLTSTYSPTAGIDLTYDNHTGEVTQINGNAAIFIEGALAVASGSNGPTGNPKTTEFTLNITNTNPSLAGYCEYYGASGAFTCYIPSSWGGTIYFTPNAGVSAQFCTNTSQPYVNITSYLGSQGFQAVKSNAGGKCVAPYPTAM